MKDLLSSERNVSSFFSFERKGLEKRLMGTYLENQILKVQLLVLEL